MSLVQVRREIDQKLDELDAEMLKAIHTLLYGVESPLPATGEDQEKIYDHLDEDFADSDIAGQIMTSEDFATKVEAIDSRMEAGEGTPADDVHKNAKKWLKSMS